MCPHQLARCNFIVYLLLYEQGYFSQKQHDIYIACQICFFSFIISRLYEDQNRIACGTCFYFVSILIVKCTLFLQLLISLCLCCGHMSVRTFPWQQEARNEQMFESPWLPNVVLPVATPLLGFTVRCFQPILGLAFRFL